MKTYIEPYDDDRIELCKMLKIRGYSRRDPRELIREHVFIDPDDNDVVFDKFHIIANMKRPTDLEIIKEDEYDPQPIDHLFITFDADEWYGRYEPRIVLKKDPKDNYGWDMINVDKCTALIEDEPEYYIHNNLLIIRDPTKDEYYAVAPAITEPVE